MANQISEALSWEKYASAEWKRLSAIAEDQEQKFKVGHTVIVTAPQYVVGNVRTLVASCVYETAQSTANANSLMFDFSSLRYRGLIDSLSNRLINEIKNEKAKEAVSRILPANLSRDTRNRRLFTFGLSEPDAIRIERLRQSGETELTVNATKLNLQIRRGNILALTEVNRIINQTVETVWVDNYLVSKTNDESVMYLEHAGIVNEISDLQGLPKSLFKTIITRRDNRTCEYCDPLEGISAKLGSVFKTPYGTFPHPPFHPRCRCYCIVGSKR